MTDQNRQSNQKRGPQQGSQMGSPRRDDRTDTQQTQGNRADDNQSFRDDMTGSGSSGNRSSSDREWSSRDSQSIADDRGFRSDHSRRSFSGDREGDELGSELDDRNSADESDVDPDEPSGRSDR